MHVALYSKLLILLKMRKIQQQFVSDPRKLHITISIEIRMQHLVDENPGKYTGRNEKNNHAKQLLDIN